MNEKLFVITFSIKTKDYGDTKKPKKGLTLDNEPYDFPADAPTIKSFDFEKLHPTNDGWIYYRRENRKSFTQPNYISRIYWNYDHQMVIKTKTIDEALEILLRYLSYKIVPQKTSPMLFLDKNLNGEIDQGRITNNSPLSEKLFNQENWPIRIQEIEIFSTCPSACNEDGFLACNHYEKPENSCIIGCRVEDIYSELNSEYCRIKIDGGKRCRDERGFFVTDQSG